MAYINVAEWTPDQVTDWLKGLDNSMYHYIQSFTNNQVGGQQLLNIRPYELEQLGMHSIGHQEIVLEAVVHLRNFHYHLDKENLQFLALHVATASSCLYRQLANHCDKKEIETNILNDITRTLVHIKPLVAWLDRSPFKGHSQFMETRDNILKFGLEMATVAQRDRFVENPVEQIRGTAQKLSKLANYIIQDITDPMVLQPASLEIVTLKKRESDLGFYITHYHGVLKITEVKFNSPAHNSGKIEEGDEIVQINYQTVVGWEYKKVLGQLQESPIDVLLTLKKRPKHTKIYGHIYMKRYRLPSNKRVLPYKWVDNIPSPRPELMSIPNYPMPLSKVPEKQVHSSLESVNSDVLTPTQSKEQDKELRMYLPKPRAVLQRRNTICGDQPTSFKHLGNVMYWLERRSENKDDDSPSLRDKSISFGFGLELSQRPTTCLGITSVPPNVKRPDLNGINGSLPEMMADTTADRNETKNNDEEKLKTGVSKVVRFDSNMKLETYHVDSKFTCNVDNTIIETFEPIPYADEEVNTQLEKSLPDVVPTAVHKAKRMSKDIGVVEAVNTIVINRELIKRGKLDKSYSTPTYDDDLENDVPPAIEPRKEYLNKIPPAPPPRPKRLHEPRKDIQNGETIVVNPIDAEPSYNNNTNIAQTSSSDANSSILPPNNDIARYTPTMKKLPPTKHFLEEIETLELLTPNKTKSLTWKKKNSLLAKRRKISLKGLGTSDIQGHLYRRAKDKHGVTYWAKLYFVLIDSALYGFKSKDSNKANCLIFLTGFTVSIANEVHSKPFAFKVYHPSKTFYFAAETKEALSQWMEYIRQATLKGNTNSLKSNSSASSNDPRTKELFTESESSDDESILSGSSNKNLQNSSTNLNSAGTKNVSPDQGTSTKTEKIRYHLDFGSLKKFTKSNLPSFSSLHKSSSNVDKKLSSNSVPVPTEQFRTYRKVPGNAGLQLGTNSMTSSSPPQNESQPTTTLTQTTLNHNPIINTSITLTPSPPQQPVPTLSTSPSLSVGNASIPSTTSNLLNTPLFIDEFQMKQPRHAFDDDFCSPFNFKYKKNRKQYAHHYIHASNPNLVEFDFQTSKSLDHSLPKINSTNTWDAHPNLQGFVTLKDLMLQKQAEEAKEMYNNRVYLGVEKKDDRLKHKNKKYDIYNRNENGNGDDISNSSNKPVINRIQSRSLPKTPDYAQSFKPDDKDIIMARSKEGQKLRDFGYEFISGDDTTTTQIQVVHSKSNSDSWLKRHDKVGPSSSSNSLKKKSMNWINPDLKKSNSNNDDDRLFSISTTHRQGSLKKAKNKLENLKASSEKLFQLKHDKHFFTKPSNMSSASSTISTSSTISASSGIIPMHHSVTHYGRGSSGSEKNSYLSKLNFNNVKTQKERKLLGSPRLHRAIFGRSNSSNDAHIDHEVFSPIKRSVEQPDSVSITGELASNPQSARNSETTNSGSPDYPNMEYPPVFEPEIYSLSDPNASLTLLRRRNNHTK